MIALTNAFTPVAETILTKPAHASAVLGAAWFDCGAGRRYALVWHQYNAGWIVRR